MPPSSKKDESGDWSKALREAAPHLGMGTSMAVTVLACLWGGHWLDLKLQTQPVFMLLGSGFGLFSAGYLFVKSVTDRKP